ncbi:uncharacterized protein LOC128504287 [Spea bombifrons]|uniref:uncharacterized protein LOC128504287 n=1 Tax=Spea bombifrons TaxID=233779 RepID=UPI00234A94F4|nr:uncharacterized protein LOC128504287 [Spea bombifrons]
MGKVEFYALWSLLEAPRQLVSKGGRMSFQLPAVSWPVMWLSSVSWPVASYLSRCLCSPRPAHRRSRSTAACGDPVCRLQVMKGSGFSSSTPARRRLSEGPPSSPLLSESTIVPVRPSDVAAEDKVQSSEVTQLLPGVRLKDSPPLKAPVARLPDGERGRRTSWKQGNPRRLRFSKESEEGTPGSVCPSARSGHSVCLCDPHTAILIGGDGANEQPCQDWLWKMELDSDFWFPMDGLCQGPAPQSSRGHSATFDPETKKLYVYGGMRGGRRFSSVYALDTLEWTWTPITAVGKVPTLCYHSATMYHRELYVFGGLCPQPGTESGSCANSLYIFNPEYKIWYQPIVEGERPLARYGHSATLLRNRVVIFGGRRTPSPVYLNDVHILDLGYMEYTSVTSAASAEKPPPRCFHAAIPVSDHKLLIHGGFSSGGPLADAFTFNFDTLCWSAVQFGGAPQLPRAAHALLNLTSSHLTDSDKEKRRGRSLCTILIVGGSDGSGNFYSDTPRYHLDLST